MEAADSGPNRSLAGSLSVAPGGTQEPGEAVRDRLWRISRDLLVTLDAAGTFISVSPAATTILGWLPEEMVGRNVLDFVLPEDVAPTRDALAHAGQDELQITENRYRHKDGGFRWMSWVAASGGGLIFASGRHVTAEKQAVQAIERLSADRNRILRNSHDLIVVVDMTGTFLSVNPASMDILGWDADDMVGRNVMEFIHPDDQPPQTAAGELDPGRYAVPRRFENRYRHRDGGWRDMSWAVSSYDALIYAYGRDVTLEKAQAQHLAAAQEHLRQSQKMEAVGQLTGGIAHDFNNLLTVIKTSIDLLRRPALPPDRRARFMDSIAHAVTRAAKLTGQLLAFARRQALQPVVFDAAKNVAAIADMISTLVGSRVTVVVHEPGGDCMVDADPGQFDTAIVNMAVNARDAMEGAGRLDIRTRRVAKVPAVRGHHAIRGNFVAVSVTDSGTGIPADKLDQIFEPFFTTKPVGQGTGLGLSQVFGFAKQSGGEIQVESVFGQGACFTLYLPLARRPGAASSVSDDAPWEASPTSGRILLVEDNVEVATSVETTLIELGYQVEMVPSAEEALVRLSDGAGRFAAVFSDVVMAGMNGIELAREIGKRYQNLPVLLSSGYSHVLASSVDHGFNLLAKPYSVDALERSLGELVSRSTVLPRKAMPVPPAGAADERENQRLAELDRLNVLDTPPEPAYDDLTQVAATLFDAPIALVSLVDTDRQWFKSKVGLEVTETTRELAFCAHAIEEPHAVMVVPDALQDARFADNPLVTGNPHIRFYAGAPLVTSNGHALGTLCVIDPAPRQPDAKQLEALALLAKQVVARLEDRFERASGGHGKTP